MDHTLIIDGSQGEGGGQIVRTSLALSAITRRPIRLQRIRARRAKGGLLRQHLTAVQAAAAICGAETRGAELRSTELWFAPGQVRGGSYHFSVGTAGSACLVLQTVLPVLLCADQASRVILEGGTHNPMAPPVDFIARSFLPALAPAGVRAKVTLERHGFYPAGGGRFVAEIQPWTQRRPLVLLERGPLLERRARALVAKLPQHIGTRELRVVRHQLGWEARECAVDDIPQSPGPGNALLLERRYQHVTQMVSTFGERGVRAETVAQRAVAEVRALDQSGAPVCPHLADQLMLPLALGSGGRYLTTAPSLHARTNLDIIRLFLHVDADFIPRGDDTEVVIAPR